MQSKSILAGALLACCVAPAPAIDHSNLDENRPLRLEDPYPIAAGEWALEAGAGYTIERRGTDRGFFPIEILYGAWPNLHLSIGSTLSTSPREIDGQERSGDLHLGALYNLNQETITLPALGLKAALDLPTGVRSAGVDVDVKAIASKSFGRLGIHVNGGYDFLSGTASGERDGRYEVVVGSSYPVGAPRYTRTLLLADVFTEQSVHHGDSNTLGTEAGFRHQLTHRIVLDFGAGSELAGPAERARLFVTAGCSVAF